MIISTKKSLKNSERRPHKSGHRKWGDFIERLSKRSFETSKDCSDMSLIIFDGDAVKIKRAQATKFQ